MTPTYKLTLFVDLLGKIYNNIALQLPSSINNELDGTCGCLPGQVAGDVPAKKANLGVTWLVYVNISSWCLNHPLQKPQQISKLDHENSKFVR